MRPPLPRCKPLRSLAGGMVSVWSYRGNLFLAGPGFGDGQRSWTAIYAAGKRETEPQTAGQIARRLAVAIPDAVPVWLL